MRPLKYDVHGCLLNDTYWRKIGVKTMKVRFFGEITGFRFTQLLYAVTRQKLTHWGGKRFRIATALRYRWCLPSRNICCLVRTCVLRIEGLPRLHHGGGENEEMLRLSAIYMQGICVCEHVLSYYVSLSAASLSSLYQTVQLNFLYMSLKYSLIEGRRLPLTPSVIHKSVAVRAKPRRDLLGDSIQPCVIDVISSLGVTVAQLARAPNVYPELPALPETLVFETTTELALHLPPIYMSDNEKLKSLCFLRIFTHNYHLTTSLRGKICVRKIGKAIEAYRAAPLDSVHRTGLRDTDSCGRQTKPGTFQTSRPNKPAKKCNGRLKSQQGNLHRSARILVEITGILVDTIFLCNIFNKTGYPSGKSVPVYVTIAIRDHTNEYKHRHTCPAMTNPFNTLEPTDKRSEFPRCAGDSSSILNEI
ncbi:hypothetical protein G5I_11294 [Acromyrmex echinatior]|uniref:Uncharacterized protein n=1 Tax=Acromyrmex echinatior TaxID=103372 RepID=F4WZ80_ACREC|nr:hypothetical protein G5I_11294 [Acromyrmex echinatior]